MRSRITWKTSTMKQTNKATKAMLARKLLLLVSLFLVLTLLPSQTFANGVTPTIRAALPASIQVMLAHPLANQRCFSKDDYKEAIRQECGEAKNKAEEWGTCKESKRKLAKERDQLTGVLKSKEEDIRVRDIAMQSTEKERDALQEELDSRWAWYTWFGIGAAALATGAGTAAFVFR